VAVDPVDNSVTVEHRPTARP